MITKIKKYIIEIIFVILIIIFYYDMYSSDNVVLSGIKTRSTEQENIDKRIHIASILCANLDMVKQFKSMLNSVILMSESDVEFHLIADDFLQPELKSLYSSLPESIQKRIIFSYYDILFPLRNYDWWKSLYRPCTTQKLFFTKIIRENVKSVIYFDLDILVVGRVEKIWALFKEFEFEQILGAIHDCPFKGCAYYNKVLGNEVGIPVVGKSGLNGGVLFMRLDVMRRSNFVDAAMNIADLYYEKLLGAEQDILNILFSKNLEMKTNFLNLDKFKFIDCSYNYFPYFYCNETNICDKTDGIKVLHGAGKVFDLMKDYSISKLYHYIRDIDFNVDKTDILNDLKRKVDEFLSNCECKSIIDKLFLY